MRIGAVVNPAAGGGRMRQEWPAFAAALEKRFGGFTCRETTGPGDASELARALARDGFDVVMAAGGDGTVSEVADGILRARAEGHEGTTLAVAPVGTGSDFAAAFGVPREAEACVERMAASAPRAIDAGRISFVDDEGRPVTRHFASIASLGVSGPIDRVINEAKSKQRGRMSGKALFYLFTLRELMRYRFQDVAVAVDAAPPVEARIALVAVANNRSFGGGMLIAPDAVMDDGLLEVVVVKGNSRLRLMKDLRLVYSGAHKGLDSCLFLRGRRITVTPLGDRGLNAALLDMDGESPGRIPASFEVLPGALTVRL
jgi:YegS/Rv2252/BmrU family lipid kinase